MNRIAKEGKIKLILSFTLFVYSVIISIISKQLIMGMFLSMGGDVLIMKSRQLFGNEKDETDFPLGVMLFAYAHMTYTLLMSTNSKIYIGAIILEGICVVMVMVMTSFIYKTKKYIIFTYAICLVLAAINAWQFHYLAGIGYTLFIASDIILALFEDKNPKWQIAIWATYVPAQILILTSFLLV